MFNALKKNSINILLLSRKLQILNKRLKIFLNYFLGPVLFIGLSFSIYRNLINQPNLAHSLQQIKASL
ncbi:MAG TPA: hypothetical protein VF610_10435, partial [Segetibacter sp.]